MPSYESPSLYIDFSRLPPPQVIEEIDYEELLRAYHLQVLEKNPALERALKLEQSGANIILEAEAYGEMIVRQRINQAARAVMLPFATGADLENLAAFFGVRREILPGNPNVSPPIPDVPESDARLRRRTQIAPEAFATAGSEGAYIFHALSAHPEIRDATAVKINDFGGVRVTIMNTGLDPVPTQAQIDAVFTRLNHKNIKPLTDVISVSPVQVKHTAINAELTLYPGPDAALVMADVQKGIKAVRDRVSLIGRDLTLSAIHSALFQEGVQDVTILSPVADISAAANETVWIDEAVVTVADARVE